MGTRRILVSVAVLMTLAACSTTSGGSATTSSATPGVSASSAASTSTAPAPVTRPAITELKTSTTSLGEVVVDGAGMTLYMFTKDTRGATASACTGACLAAWPLVVAADTPKLAGITGAVGSINTTDGRKQVTLNGWPLYYFAKDAKPGDVTGQNVNQVWFVLDKTGTPVTK